MEFTSYECVFNGKIHELHILINEKSNRESQDISEYPGTRIVSVFLNCKALF